MSTLHYIKIGQRGNGGMIFIRSFQKGLNITFIVSQPGAWTYSGNLFKNFTKIIL